MDVYTSAKRAHRSTYNLDKRENVATTIAGAKEEEEGRQTTTTKERRGTGEENKKGRDARAHGFRFDNG